MTTKERILEEALHLFAEKGFDGVSMREIAAAVNIKASSLYKHYTGKDDIFQNVVSMAKERSKKAYENYKIPNIMSKTLSAEYEKFSADAICDMAWNLFCFYTKDSIMSPFRKLLAREQYANPEIAKIYNDFFLEGAVLSESRVFSAFVESGFFRAEDPAIIALHFYGPIFLLFQEFDCNPENEQAIKEKIYTHVRAFGRAYAG